VEAVFLWAAGLGEGDGKMEGGGARGEGGVNVGGGGGGVIRLAAEDEDGGEELDLVVGEGVARSFRGVGGGGARHEAHAAAEGGDGGVVRDPVGVLPLEKGRVGAGGVGVV